MLAGTMLDFERPPLGDGVHRRLTGGAGLLLTTEVARFTKYARMCHASDAWTPSQRASSPQTDLQRIRRVAL
jgi:hypothetical protein